MVDDRNQQFSQGPGPLPNQPTQRNRTKPKAAKKWLMASAFIGTLFAGVMIGTAGTSTPDAEAKSAPAVTEPEPAPTVTVTPEPVVKTKTVEVEVTPQSCIKALDHAKDAMTILIPLPEMVHEAAVAGSEFDAATIESISGRLTDISSEMDTLTPKVATSTAECRSSQ